MSTEWVDYVEPMKYQALRPHFFSVGGWVGVGGGIRGCQFGGRGGGVLGVLVRDVVGDGGRVGGGMGDGVLSAW